MPSADPTHQPIPFDPHRCPLGCKFRYDDVADHLAAAHGAHAVAEFVVRLCVERAQLQAELERIVWLQETDQERKDSPLSRAVLDLFGAGTLTLESIVDSVGERPPAVAACLARMERRGIVRKVAKGTWRLERSQTLGAPAAGA